MEEMLLLLLVVVDVLRVTPGVDAVAAVVAGHVEVVPRNVVRKQRDVLEKSLSVLNVIKIGSA